MQHDNQQSPGGDSHLAISALNHISRVCRDVQASIDFYVDVLGFVTIRRPSSLERSFDGAWLFKRGLGVHLIEGSPPPRSPEIIPKSDHISFVADDLEGVAAQLSQRGIHYVRQCVDEHGLRVQQLFFHDPDRNMIEICNCHVLPVLPLAGPQELQRCHTCAEAARELQDQAHHARELLPDACWSSGRLASQDLEEDWSDGGSGEDKSCFVGVSKDMSRDSGDSCQQSLSPRAAARLEEGGGG